jgi:hypothetical protein
MALGVDEGWECVPVYGPTGNRAVMRRAGSPPVCINRPRLTAGLKTGGRDWVAVRQRKSLLIGIELYYGKVIA